MLNFVHHLHYHITFTTTTTTTTVYLSFVVVGNETIALHIQFGLLRSYYIPFAKSYFVEKKKKQHTHTHIQVIKNTLPTKPLKKKKCTKFFSKIFCMLCRYMFLQKQNFVEVGVILWRQ